MGLLKQAKNNMAFLKMGIFGDTGSGKTWTASEVAIGLHSMIKSERPVAFFDTETGSSFVLPKFQNAGIDLMVYNGTALKDLAAIFDEVESEKIPILIIDSITNVWDEFTEAYRRKQKRGFIELYDWKPIKDDWRKNFRNRFVNSNVHVIMCGREGAVYEAQETERNGKVKKETIKAGTKMRAEGDTGYEPSLLVEMIKVYSDGKGIFVRQGNVVKERFGVIDSKTFDNPTFKDFMPHIKLLNLGGEHSGINAESTSESMFASPDYSYVQEKKQKEIVCEEIKEIFVLNDMDGSGADVKKSRVELLIQAFGTSVWTKIQDMPINELNSGIILLKEYFEKQREKK